MLYLYYSKYHIRKKCENGFINRILGMNIGMFWKILYFMKKTKTINKDLGLQVFNLGMTMLLTLATLSIILLEIFGILL